MQGAAAVEVENSHVSQLEAEVVQREQDICSLKEQLNAAFKAAAVAGETGTVAVKIDASNSGERVDGITAQLAEAIKVKDALTE